MKDLRTTIKENSQSKEFDCLLMLSGGKDSSWLLYHLSEELKLNVLTVSLVHDFMPDETVMNIESFASRFSKKHVNVPNHYLNHAGRHFLNTWIHTPDAGSLITLCTGCRLGLVRLIMDVAKKEGVNVVINGATPYEATDFRLDLVNYPPGKKGIFFFFLGYLRLVLRNPKLVADLKSLRYQADEFYSYTNQMAIWKKNGILYLKPYVDFLSYNEQHIIETLDRLGWRKTSFSTRSAWRSDCNMYAMRHFFYNQLCGYNEIKEYYEKLYKNNQIDSAYLEQNTVKHFSPEEVLELLKKSGLSERSMSEYEKYIHHIP